MGRYAFFTTGLEYKFAFGVQDSADIRSFGGIIRHDLYRGGDLHHEWGQQDLKTIFDELLELIDYREIHIPDFEKYEDTLNGTHTLKWDIEKTFQNSTYSGERIARFILGSLIYHQLLYTEVLRVHYEV
jgi:hypothetical protein